MGVERVFVTLLNSEFAVEICYSLEFVTLLNSEFAIEILSL